MHRPDLFRCALAAALACTFPMVSGVHAAEPLGLRMLRGGDVAARPVVSGEMAYMATGRTIATWDYSDPAHPLRIATSAPAGGVINGLVRAGGYLHASWRGYDGSSGVATWSLAAPRAPRLVHDNNAYLSAEYKTAIGLAAAGDRLYLFDLDHGLLVGSLANPAAPVFSTTAITDLPAAFTDFSVHGTRIHASGRTWTSTTMHTVYDVSVPDVPVRVSSDGVNGLDTYRLLGGSQTAIGVGNQLTVFDVASGMVPLGSTWMPPATAGARVGADHVYSYGAGEGLDIWTVANPAAPKAVAHSSIDAFAGHHAVPLGKGGLLLQTRTDLVHALDVSSPGAPQRVSTGWMPGGVSAVDAIVHDGKAVLLQSNYGLSVSDQDTLAPLARVEADMPRDLASRSFEQVAMAGDIAWMAAWGFGLVAVDLAAQGGPRVVGKLPYEFAATVAVDGTRAYVARWTNGGGLAVVDITRPSAPALLSQVGLVNQPYRLHAAGGYVYMAQSAEWDAKRAGGMQVFDVSGSGAPVPVAHVDDGCGNGFDLDVDDAMGLAYLACGDGIRVIDIANPRAPVVIGRYLGGDNTSYSRVTARGELAWFADSAGLHELDMADPTAPKLRALTSLGGGSPARLLATDDQRLFALGGVSGVHVFGPDARLLTARVPASGLSGADGDSLLFAIRVPSGRRSLTVFALGGSGKLRLEARHRAVPEDGVADGASAGGSLRIATPAAGLYYIRATGVGAFSGKRLEVSY